LDVEGIIGVVECSMSFDICILCT
jgi:hypothetical protein